MTIDFTALDWFKAPQTQAIFKALSADGARPRAVGGCVRDSIMGRVVHDVDMATTTPPSETMALLQAAGIKAIPTGIDHGTVTAVFEGQSFEITTLRADVSTDGRRATVAFSTDWLEDAQRRDFTFNALSVDQDGILFDPFEGAADALAGRVRFIGDAALRVQEDYLRILRFFRFNAQLEGAVVNETDLAACVTHKAGIAQLSGERLASELFKILSAAHPTLWLSLMIEHSILSDVLPDIQDTKSLNSLCVLDDSADPARRLMALLPSRQEAVQRVVDRLRLSKRVAKRLYVGRGGSDRMTGDEATAAFETFMYHYGAEALADQLFLHWADQGVSDLGGREQEILTLIQARAESPRVFPVQGRDLIALGVKAGPEMGQILQKLKEKWCQRGCRDDRATCLSWLPKDSH